MKTSVGKKEQPIFMYLRVFDGLAFLFDSLDRSIKIGVRLKNKDKQVE